jgi:hypothetical protein
MLRFDRLKMRWLENPHDEVLIDFGVDPKRFEYAKPEDLARLRDAINTFLASERPSAKWRKKMEARDPVPPSENSGE